MSRDCPAAADPVARRRRRATVPSARVRRGDVPADARELTAAEAESWRTVVRILAAGARRLAAREATPTT